MNRLSPLAFAAALLATGVSVMASSQAQAATVRVHYGDLDLTTAQGRLTLGRRIGRAAYNACWIENRTLAAVAACRRDSVADAELTLERTVRDQGVQLASR